MEAKTTRGYRLSLHSVRLQSPVSNLNLLCHLKSSWTNLTLACNNRLEECLSVVCVSECVTTGLPALIMALEDYDNTYTHTTQEINQNYMQYYVCISARSMWTQTHEHEIRPTHHCGIDILLADSGTYSFHASR